MKYIFFILIFLFAGHQALPQQKEEKTRKEIRAEKEAKKKAEIKQLIDSEDFIFQATHALPLGGGSIFLNHDYDVHIKKDSVFSYLPFYGVAYHIEYGGRNSGFIFEEPVEDFSKKFDRENYLIKFGVDRGNDNITFTFHVTELGYATLNINSTNRQSISYYGFVEKKEED
jgi:hypothetical protein